MTAREIISAALNAYNLKDGSTWGASCEIVNALTEAGYTIEQWIEFDPEDEANIATGWYLLETDAGRYLCAARNGGRWKESHTSLGELHIKVKRYKAIAQ